MKGAKATTFYKIMTMTMYFSVLAMSMLPDGAETQLDDWTIFFLNQTPFNTISPVLALDTPEVRAVGLPGEHDNNLGSNKPDLLCVLNLVRTKHDKTLDRHVYHTFLQYSLLTTICRT